MNFVHFIELLLVVGILIALGIPLFGKTPKKDLFSAPDQTTEEYKHLLVRKEEVLLSIKELEFDLKTLKVSETDYADLRKKLEKEAMVILERIDEMEKQRKKNRKASKPAKVS